MRTEQIQIYVANLFEISIVVCYYAKVLLFKRYPRFSLTVQCIRYGFDNNCFPSCCKFIEFSTEIACTVNMFSQI